MALTSSWIRRTGWLETFAGVDRPLLSRLASAPAREGFPLLLADDVESPTQSSIEDESKLSNLGKAVDHFFDRCEDTARNTDHSIRCWLISHVQGRPYKAAFQLPGRCNTRKRYRWFWKSMMYFVLRLWRLDDAVREKKLGLRLSTKQSKAIQELWTFLSAEENATQVFCGELRRDFRISPPGQKLPRLNASRFLFGANCMHVIKLKRVAMQHGKSASRSFLVM